MERGKSAAAPLDSPLLVAFFLLIAFCAGHPLHSPDFFWHLALGDVVRQTGSIPRTDLFSAVAPERTYVQFNWLWDWAVSWLYAGLGPYGVRAMQALLMTTTLAGFFLWLRRVLLGPAWALAFSALAFVLFEDRLRARPDSLTLAFTLSQWPLSLRVQRGYGGQHWVYGAALALLWTNVHGGASLLLLLSYGALWVGSVIWAWMAPGRSIRRERSRQTRYLFLLSGLALFLSPTTLPGLAHWLTAIQPQVELGNEEWLPSYTILRHGLTPAHLCVGLGPTLVALLYGTVELVRFRRRGRAALNPALILLCVGYLVLAHLAVRNAFLCLIPLLCIARHFPPRLRRARQGWMHWGGLAGAALLLGVAFEDGVVRAYGGLAQARLYYGEAFAPDAYPVHAARFIRGARLEGSIVNDGRWGGYLIHQLYPRHGVLVDTRHHLVDGMWRVFNDTHTLSRRGAGLDFGFARYGLELAVFPAPVFTPQSATEWELLFKAGPEEVYQHREGPHAAENRVRAERYIRQQITRLPESLAGLAASARDHPALATVVGAAAYLSEPRQQWRFAVAAELLGDSATLARARGYRIRGKLWAQAGLYQAALSDYEAALSLEPLRPDGRAQVALCLWHVGRPRAARALLRGMSPALFTTLSISDRWQLAALARLD